ncbi:MAG: MATE family efflux transporter [bacterium]
MNAPVTRARSSGMLEGPVGPTLFRLTLPMIMGIVSIMLINIIDTFYIGQLGVRELAAISFTFPVVFTVMSLAFGIGIGTSSVVSRAIGQGDPTRVRRLTTYSLYLTAVLMSLISAVGLITIEPVFTAMGASEDMLEIIRDYMTLWYLGVGLLAIPIVGNSAIRATGDSKTPSRVMLVIAVVNAALDPFLIFGLGPFPQMGVQGAALATVIAYFFALLAGLWILGKREQMLEGGFPRPQHLWESWRPVLFIGMPAALTSMLAPISNAILTRMVSEYGTNAVAAFGVGTRLESLALLGVMSLSAILTPFVGQNFGARKPDRIRDSLVFSTRFSLFWGVGACLLLASGAVPISAIFSDADGVRELTQLFLWSVPFSFGFYGLAMLASAACNGLHRPMQSTTINLLRLFVLILPLAWIGSTAFGLLGIFLGIAVGNIISGLGAMFWLRRNLLPDLLLQMGVSPTPAAPTPQ